jgi:hypothetical protein
VIVSGKESEVVIVEVFGVIETVGVISVAAGVVALT